MKIFEAETTINASPETIWEVLADSSGYPDWDPAMDHIEGKLTLGETVKFFTKLSDQAFPVKVTTFEPGRKMVLTGGIPFGLFKSERITASLFNRISKKHSLTIQKIILNLTTS